ncbi:MAG: 2-oxo acid dehydrogenase subunit E2 [Deltaproteobacteria bacterium]|jgi:pyruvate dehydrogenase E2 component (dihydrolipoamide acetyltransferase)|nr:2-oxo acid dehydrogenase subunit E2 [Deltaproteobacteria bacterium]
MDLLDFRLPDIGEGVSEGEIIEWFVHKGDSVTEDDPMVEVMTDKATVTIGAPCDGRVVELRFEVGAIAKVGQVLFVLEPASEPGARQAGESSRPPASAVGEISDALPGATLLGRGEAQTRPLATPATRRLAREMGVDLRAVPPSGAGGRVTSEDVRGAAGVGTSEPGPRASLEEREPILGVRRKIAERMHRAKTTAAHFTFVEECDASALVEARERLAPEAARRGVMLTFLPFIIKAVTAALQRHPRLNSAVDERRNELVYKKYYDIGIATATDAGLVVPVVRQADRLSLFELARRVEQLALAAREGRLTPEELRGSTFTITSLGKRGGLLATPILNYPEVGILGVHRMRETPVVRDGEIVIGQVMLLSLSFDHRVIDGHIGAEFAYDVIETLENPERLLYE